VIRLGPKPKARAHHIIRSAPSASEITPRPGGVDRQVRFSRISEA